jgi:hypothetical protein
MSNLILLSGKSFVGKDTFAKIFQRMSFEKSTITWENKKFAYKLKLSFSTLTGISVEDLEKQSVKAGYLPEDWNYTDENGKTKRMTVREGLIRMGHGMRENLHKDVWVNALFVDIQEKPFFKPKKSKNKSKGFLQEVLPTFATNSSNIIVSDLRYLNEAERGKAEGGILIRINSDRANIIDHESETELDDYEGFDFTIDNSGTIEELTEMVDEIGNVIGLWN